MKKIRFPKPSKDAPYQRGTAPYDDRMLTEEEVEAQLKFNMDTYALLEARWEERQRKEQELKDKANKKP